MRDGDSTLIELLDADPAAFGGADLPPAPRHELPAWIKPASTAIALLVATVAVLVWRPWHHEPEPPLSNRLLLDRPTSSVLDVSVDRLRSQEVTADPGFVFAEEGAVLPWAREAGGRSLIWTAYPVDSVNAAYGMSGLASRAVDDIQGAPAMVGGGDGSLRLVFGPIAGRMFDITSNGLTLDEATIVARAIGVEHGAAMLLGGDDLLDRLGLRRVGTYEQLTTAMGLLSGPRNAPTDLATTSVGFVDGTGGAVRVSSVRDPDGSLLTMLRAVLGPTGSATVHRREAIATRVQLPFSDDSTADSLVAWQEGGRLVVVTGNAALDTTVAAAETTHEVTEEEWAPVAAQAGNDAWYSYSSTIGYRRGADGSVTEVVASSNRPDSVAVCLTDELGGTECAFESDLQLPFLKIMRIHTVALIVAVVQAGSTEPQLRLTHTDGSVDVHLLFAPSLELPGPAVAVFLPDDLRDAALVVDGEVVATL